MVGMTTDTRLHVPPHEEFEKALSEILVSVVGIVIAKEDDPHGEQLEQTFGSADIQLSPLICVELKIPRPV